MTGTLQKKADRKLKVRKGEPITECGLTFYPIMMDYYEEFNQYKDAIILRQATLPVKYLSMDYLSALFALDFDAIREKKHNTGLFYRAMAMLCLSLRIGFDIEILNKNISVAVENNRIVLKQIAITQDTKTATITPQDFSFKIRKLIAEQNGLELPDESENVDLVKSNEQLKDLKNKAKQLNVNLDDLIASIAYQSRISESEIYEWSIREFENRRKAIDRDKRFMLCGQGEMSGMVQFKNGNPSPSWYYDVLDNSLGTMAVSELMNKLDGVAEQKNS